MSNYTGRIITKTPVTISTTQASGVWTLHQAMQAIKSGIWPGLGSTVTQSFTTTGYWTAPTGVTQVDYLVVASGGGGGYGYGCFHVVSGSTYTITVGNGGSGLISGGPSSVGSLISATGGSPGGLSTNCISASGGLGGTSNATYSLVGETGGIGTGCPPNTLGCGGNGGKSANGGTGGAAGCTWSNGSPGIAPGGGGGGTWTAPQVNNTSRVGGSGARGQVIIYF